MYIHQSELLDAIALFNAVAHQRTRKVEWGMIHAFKNHDTVAATIETAKSVPVDKVIQFDGASRFQRDVQAIVGLLEFDGTLAVKVEKQPTVFYRKAHRIAAELQSRGLCWVKVQHVEAAQQLKAHKAA